MKLGYLIHDRVIFQKSVFGFLYCYSIFFAISFRVIDVRYSEFIIISLLYYAQYYRDFLYLQYSGYSRRAIKYAVQLEFYCKAMLSGQYYSTSFEDLYSRKCRRCPYSDYCSVNLRALLKVIHMLIGIIPVYLLFVFILPLIEIARTQFL